MIDRIPQSLIDNPIALSVRQPWAWLIVNGYKDIENRTWPTGIRGWVFIHTGQKGDFANFVQFYYKNRNLNFLSEINNRMRCRMGGIVGIAEIVDCVTESESEWFQGPFGFVIEKARPIQFIEYKRTLGFFEPKIVIKV